MGRLEPALGHACMVRQGGGTKPDGARLRDSCQRLEPRAKSGVNRHRAQKSLRSLGLMIYPPCEGGDQAVCA